MTTDQTRRFAILDLADPDNPRPLLRAFERPPGADAARL